MPDNRSSNLDRPVGELWVELSREEKKKICDALIDRNESDVMQEFASLVRFTRGYLREQPNGSPPSSNGMLIVFSSSAPGSQPTDNGIGKRKNEEVPVNTTSTTIKKPRKQATVKAQTQTLRSKKNRFVDDDYVDDDDACLQQPDMAASN